MFEQRGCQPYLNKQSFTCIKQDKEVTVNTKLSKYILYSKKDGDYFMKLNDDIYKYDRFYEIRLKCKLQTEDKSIVTKDLSTGLKTAYPEKETKMIEFKDNHVYIDHNGNTKRIISYEKTNVKLLEIEFYYKFKYFLILLDKENQYNITIDTFDNLITCKNSKILKEIYSVVYNNTEIEEGLCCRDIYNNKETEYEYTNGLNYIKNSYFKGYEIDDELSIQKEIFI